MRFSVTSALGAMNAIVLFTSSCLADEAHHPRPDPKRFSKEIEKFTLAEVDHPVKKGGIVFTGSSSIRLWGDLSKVFPDLPVINRGFGGSVANDLIVYAQEVALRYEPKVLVVYEGGNDLNAKLTPEEALADETQFIELVHAKLPKTRVIVNSVKYAPVRIKQLDSVKALNVLLENWCKGKSWVTWLESSNYLLGEDGQPHEELYRADRLHLNDAGYAKWKALLDPVLHKVWAEANS